jgi:Uma2 family endonuclease
VVAATNLVFDNAEAERRFLLTDVPWWTYVALRDVLESSRIRMTYLEGILELMSPSELHEEEGKLIARLLEAWADEVDADLRGFKSATFRKEAGQRGAEPDECYTLGPKPKDALPHLAIEVIISNPLVDKLEVYAGLGVAEVWMWRAGALAFVVHRLADSRYTVVDRSQLLPTLDLTLLASFVRPGESHTALVKAFRVALRTKPAQ